MKSFKVDEAVELNWDAIKKSDLDERARKYLVDREGQTFRITKIEDEDDKEIHTICDNCGIICPTGLYADEMLKFRLEWDK